MGVRGSEHTNTQMKENKLSLVMASMCLEPLYLIRGEMKLPLWTMMPAMVNFVLTY